MPNGTKEMIVASFYEILHEKNFEKITVKDIVDGCGINRKTFYYYFKDIYDLVEYAMRTELEKYMDTFSETMTLESYVSDILEFTEKNRKVVCHINLNSDGELKKYLHIALYDTVFRKYRSRAVELHIQERDFKLLCEFIVMSFMSMFSAWIESGMSAEFKEDIKRICVMLGGSVDDMIGSLKKLGLSEKL